MTIDYPALNMIEVDEKESQACSVTLTDNTKDVYACARRSSAHKKLENWDGSLSDANAAVTIDTKCEDTLNDADAAVTIDIECEESLSDADDAVTINNEREGSFADTADDAVTIDSEREDSVNDSDSAVVIDAECEDGWFQKAAADAALGDWDDAAFAYCRCLDINPAHEAAIAGLFTTVTFRWRTSWNSSPSAEETIKKAWKHITNTRDFVNADPITKICLCVGAVRHAVDELAGIQAVAAACGSATGRNLAGELEADLALAATQLCAKALLNLGRIMSEVDGVDEFLQFYFAAYAVLARQEVAACTVTTKLHCEIHTGIAFAYSKLLTPRKGIFFAKKATEYATETGDPEALSTVLALRGHLHLETDDLQTAADLLSQAINLREKNALVPWTSLYANMSTTLYGLGALEKALGFSDRAVGLARAEGDNQMLARCLSVMSEILINLSNLAAAKCCLDELCEVDDSPCSRLVYHTEMGQLLCQELGEVEKDSARYSFLVDDAIEHFRAALAIAPHPGTQETMQLELHAKIELGGLLGRERGDKAAEEALLIAAIRLGRKLCDNSEHMASALLNYATNSLNDDANAIDKAIDMLIEAESLFRASSQRVQQDEFRVSLASRGRSIALYDVLTLAHLQNSDRSRALEAQEQARSSALLAELKRKEGAVVKKLTAAEMIARAAALNVTFVVYWLPIERSLVNARLLWSWVISSRKIESEFTVTDLQRASSEVRIPPTNAFSTGNTDTNRDAKTFDLSTFTDVELSGKSMSELYSLLWKPVETLIPAKERVIIVPQGSLWNVPFAALLDENNRPLIEKHALAFSPSIGVLSVVRKESPPLVVENEIAIVVGNPATPAFSKLPAAEEEAQEVAKLLSANGAKTRLLVGVDATKTAVLGGIEKCQIIHLATHGFVRDTEKQDYLPGGLFLAGSAAEGTNARLLAYDVQQLDLRQLRLAVLSCCHSGAGDIGEDGLLGMGRAFMFAGCEAVVVAKWAIADNETRLFMLEFYKDYLVTRDAASALRSAQMVRRSAGALAKDWGAFCVLGVSSHAGE